MTNKKTPDGNQELEPIWTNNKVAAHADALYETYRKLNEENREQFLGVLLKDFCILQGRFHQLEEAFIINRKVSSGAAEVSHVAAQKYQEFDATLKNQGKNFSKRLENLEHHGF